jgi:hypothetical protein
MLCQLRGKSSVMASKQPWMHDELSGLHSCNSSMLQHHSNHTVVTPSGQLVQRVSCVLDSQGNVHHVCTQVLLQAL